MPYKYHVKLTREEREILEKIVSKGSHKSQKYQNALILLNCDEGEHHKKEFTNEQISNFLNISMRKIDRVKGRFVMESFEIALNGKKNERIYAKKIDGDVEAHIIALSCSEPPEGRVRWTLRLLADKAVELEYVESISHETVRGILKKNEIKPWKKIGWVTASVNDSNFVAQMEIILDVYKRPYSPEYPLICMDESPKQLISEVRNPIPASPGSPERIDYEYSREGVCNIFMACEPLAGKRIVKVTKRKTKKDWAVFIKQIADMYSSADKITLVMDNYATHVPGSLYEVYSPEMAKAILDRFEFVYTPKHGSWLNIAEIELNVLTRQCLNRRIDCIEKIISEVKAWEESRNNLDSTIKWQFTTDDARVKLHRLYPTIEA